ncbi:RdgB/HAM1 family non-canonical purine NTP pyrophosphatase [Ferrovum sp. PN-J185]|uniref:RdgB/HAM1 family non-canonical purine NTP pyrophosphatase n=1 Tax=Ferrovum sp. PN-J185 TaxID=1356306 RepID=UPI0007920D1C|nr:RdgB/HAM1 family non-canonical purine NTP pyrophosphatase [Ferrovum sp. PN-J185]KXW56010.1 dITP/XTP pyrophosphatase [Ferrovum sp. PN-J185]MCC6068278.1 RdgB/HAM1 family non-canonical purine NTP pyrophosphatase [Ferrovum sp. PN-J185]MDE1892287.1 RdgB/HAM1 family non-canonical purine NTP pyrophosphatase [Betaproteobacteria bacterium]MDE2056667.1 RdgB/HAM1 family non-canonical purine NTP pyrophosphatase [Betaproteobacteria bacterium]
MTKKIIIASHNQGKLQEIRTLLDPLPLNVVGAGDLLLPEPEEPFTTFIENALHKARYVSRLTASPALADDSGLCVDHLMGAPGIMSARFAGLDKSDEKNNQKLLDLLHNVSHRSAHFICCIVLVRHESDPDPIISIGKWYGQIARNQSGSNGFGYDPLFYIPELKKTAAQLTQAEKNQFSHRAKALQGIIQALQKDSYFND